MGQTISHLHKLTEVSRFFLFCSRSAAIQPSFCSRSDFLERTGRLRTPLAPSSQAGVSSCRVKDLHLRSLDDKGCFLRSSQAVSKSLWSVKCARRIRFSHSHEPQPGARGKPQSMEGGGGGGVVGVSIIPGSESRVWACSEARRAGVEPPSPQHAFISPNLIISPPVSM